MTQQEKKPAILIVDDSFANRMLLLKIFSAEYDVMQAENGVRALEMLRQRPDTAAVVLDIQMPELDGYGVLSAMAADSRLAGIPVVVDTGNEDVASQLKALDMGAVDVLIKPFNPQIALHRIRNIITRREADRQAALNRTLEELLRQSEIDEKTGIYNKHAFCRRTAELLRSDPGRSYVLIRWDVDRFKVFNDVFGVAAGDSFLAWVGEAYKKYGGGASCGHWEADHFVMCMPRDEFERRDVAGHITALAADFHQDFEFTARLGVYVIEDSALDVALMCDRALLALRSIKNDYTRRVAFYDESMRSAMLEEQEIVSEMDRALEQGQFVVYLQPQYNYPARSLHGAEALVRWQHPDKGLIPPGKFIPIFERNGFISRVDEYVWEWVCRMQRRWLDAGLDVVPVSVNISRRDIYNPRLSDSILGLVKKYGLSPALLRLEITESAYMENAGPLIRTVETLRAAGFAVEMDDFGSGYSSLNTLKDVPVDMLKLDMKFLEDSAANTRGGSILTSVIRMSHWIRLPVIAEGVETPEQAEYLQSIGCLYMQGYYFARPMPAEDYEALLRDEALGRSRVRSFSGDIGGAEDFLSAASQTTLLFNSFVGGAAIMEYDGRNLEALRLNDKYYEVLGTTRDEYKDAQLRLLERFDGPNRALCLDTIRRAVDTGLESSCELCSLPLREGGDEIWTKARIRLLARSESRCILYCAIENITARVKLTEQLTAIMDSVPGGILDFELSDGVRTVYFNDIAASMFGYGREEYERLFAGDPLSAVHSEDLPGVRRQIDQVLDGGRQNLEVTYRRRCSGGRWRWARLTAHVVRRKNGSVYASGILLDVDAEVRGRLTAARQAREIERQRVSLKALYDTIPCGIMQFSADADAEGRTGLLGFNDTAWKIFGYESRDDYLSSVHGRSKLKDIYPEDLPVVRECIAALRDAAPGARQDCEHRIIAADGSIRWLRSLFQRVRYRSQEDAVQVVFTDITERQQQELERLSGELFGPKRRAHSLAERQMLVRALVSRRGAPREERITDADGDRYRIVVEQTGMAVIDRDYESGEFYCSEAYRKYAGSRASQEDMFNNSGDRSLVHPDDQAALDGFFAQSKSGAPRAEAVLRLKMTDGSFRWTRMAGSFFYADGGALRRIIGTFTDVDSEMRSKHALQRVSERMSRIIENIPTGVVIYELGERPLPVYVSDRACEIFGCTREEYDLRIANGEPLDFVPDGDTLPEGGLQKLLAGQSLILQALPARRRDGSPFWLRVYCSASVGADGVTLCYAVLADISRQVALEQRFMWQAEKYKILSESADMITFDYSPQDDVMCISLPRPGEGLRDEIRERYLERFSAIGRIPDGDRASFVARLRAASREATRASYDFRGDYFGTGLRWYRAKYVSLADSAGRVYRVIGRLDDISDIMREQDQLRVDAQLDEMTGVYNKKYAAAAIDRALRERTGDSLDAVFFMDIDNFKSLNDTFGHLEADSVLRQTGDIFRRLFRKDDIIARFGGDEFIVYMRSAGGAENVTARAREVIKAMGEIGICGQRPVRCSVGITTISGPGESYESVLKRADKALYEAKAGGKGRCVLLEAPEQARA